MLCVLAGVDIKLVCQSYTPIECTSKFIWHICFSYLSWQLQLFGIVWLVCMEA